MIGWACRQVAIWFGLSLLLWAGASSGLFVGARDDHGTAAAVERPAAAAPFNSLTFRADPRGHVWLDGVVNGAPVRFLVDTGATFVALTLQDAAAASIGRGGLSFTAAMETANGRARAAPVRLREIRVGQLAVNEVDAVVQENLGVSLLGMSFLRRIGGYEMRDGVLTLSW
jgi:aspartyl protease family protein